MAKTTLPVNNDRPLSIEEAYAARPRLWWAYTLVVLIVAALLGWSVTSITYNGLATKGLAIAQGIGNGLIHPDTGLLFNLTNEGVPYQLLQTVAIAVLGTVTVRLPVDACARVQARALLGLVEPPDGKTLFLGQQAVSCGAQAADAPVVRLDADSILGRVKLILG